MGDVRASDYFNDAMLRAHNDCNCASVTEATDRLGCSVRPWSAKISHLVLRQLFMSLWYCRINID